MESRWLRQLTNDGGEKVQILTDKSSPSLENGARKIAELSLTVGDDVIRASWKRTRIKRFENYEVRKKMYQQEDKKFLRT